MRSGLTALLCLLVLPFTSLGRPPGAKSQEDTTAVLFEEAEALFIRYTSIHLESVEDMRVIKKVLMQKSETLKKVTEAYTRITKMNEPEWMVASLCKLGLAYENFADFFVDVPVPAKLTPEQGELFKSMLEEKGFPFVDKAIQHHQAAIDRAGKEKIITSYVELSRTSLKRLRERKKIWEKKNLEQKMRRDAERAERAERAARRPPEPVLAMSLDAVRQKLIDEEWERARRASECLPPRRLQGAEVPFVPIPLAVSPDKETRVGLTGMDWAPVETVQIGVLKVKFKVVSESRIEITVPEGLSLGPHDMTVTFRDKAKVPVVNLGGLWVCR